MERSEKIGLGVALAGHVVLFGLLSVGFLATPNPLKLKATPIEVTLSDDVAMEAEAPQSTEAPAQSVAPEQGKPEEAAPPAPVEAPPEPTPPLPKPAEPQPQPKPKPAEVAKPAPPKPKPQPAPPKPAPTKQAAKPAPAAKSQPTPAKATGKSPTATAAKPRGSRLGADFLKGISDQPSKSRTQTPRAAKVGARDIASIAGLIRRQVQPCYDLGSLGGTSAMDITTVLRLQFKRDGSIAAATVSEQEGVNDDNRGYAKQMGELSRRAVLRCSPLKGLPPELYDGGWADFDMGFIPRQLG
ncbi:conserved hypothetical protein [Sphingomonas sp. EC-HK361]|jgi:outer membrane biosynthesis protein TonB|uniref:hypothetical protein n=1 Tax=Sphingomonas sp. EC-HK361 TaxID=2038397 RepID=UPI001251F7E2|nr:hypothetical protein [Sphingomonas sp. EC-HK361]VVT13764.1 conserved hypothetical protein [Sphingomonas sp. EC-HK361]